MKKAMDLILKGQEKLKQLGLETTIIVSDPQSHTSIDKIEKRFKIGFPEDYREFVSHHGLITVLLGGSERFQMLDMESIAEETIDLREDLLDSSDLSKNTIKNIIPFQYLRDDLVEEYYVFRINSNTQDIDIFDLDERWNRLENNKNNYAANFTEHIEKFIESVINNAKTLEKK